MITQKSPARSAAHGAIEIDGPDQRVVLEPNHWLHCAQVT
jgi:hypothetical protein